VDKDGGSETIQFVADVGDGSVMVVTHPVAAKDPNAVRVFYGRPPALDERRIIDIEHFANVVVPLVDGGDAPDAGGPWRFRITFEVGVASYSIWFPNAAGQFADGVPARQGVIDEGNATQPSYTQRWPTPAALPGLSFTCL
jgi:hypothetical protein